MMFVQLVEMCDTYKLSDTFERGSDGEMGILVHSLLLILGILVK